MQLKAVLVGTAGHVAGEELVLEYGKKVVVGRSRAADWSLVRMKGWTAKTEDQQKADDAFRTISGRHFEITMVNLGSIELANLSPNGTQLDGKPVQRETITDVSAQAHEIRFGADEVVRLEARTQEDAPSGAQPSEPPPPPAC